MLGSNIEMYFRELELAPNQELPRRYTLAFSAHTIYDSVVPMDVCFLQCILDYILWIYFYVRRLNEHEKPRSH